MPVLPRKRVKVSKYRRAIVSTRRSCRGVTFLIALIAEQCPQTVLSAFCTDDSRVERCEQGTSLAADRAPHHAHPV